MGVIGVPNIDKDDDKKRAKVTFLVDLPEESLPDSNLSEEATDEEKASELKDRKEHADLKQDQSIIHQIHKWTGESYQSYNSDGNIVTKAKLDQKVDDEAEKARQQRLKKKQMRANSKKKAIRE